MYDENLPSLDVPTFEPPPSLIIPEDEENDSVIEISTVSPQEQAPTTRQPTTTEKKKKSLAGIIPKENSSPSLHIPTFTPIGSSGSSEENNTSFGQISSLASPMPNVVGSGVQSGRKKSLFRKSSIRGPKWREIIYSTIGDHAASGNLKV
jgi:hypothetical protein